MVVHDYSKEKVIDVRSKSTSELRKLLFSLDMEMDIVGEDVQKTIMVSGDSFETKKIAEEIFKELRYRAGMNNRQFYDWVTKPPVDEEKQEGVKEVNLPKPSCMHAYHSTHTFVFGGGFEVPYNINKGESYDDDGSILAFVDPTKYKNKSQLVPALHSKTRAALRAKLIANGNHDAALHL